VFTRNMTLTDVQRLEAKALDAGETLQMDEDAFRAFYDRTARPLWVYLARITGEAQAADDLLQEAYYRLLRTPRTYATDAHRRNYLFRIATNLVHDVRRRPRMDQVPFADEQDAHHPRTDNDVAERTARRSDLARAMARLKPRERELLWLAYAQGSSHREIADSLGLKAGSIKLLLFRARRRLATFLRGTA
jgi:RNA polymerase sigma-70 factor (ECF subfamily)